MTRQLLLGPPGCGKTHALINIVRNALAMGIAPDRIGYVSFTRKAVLEAVDRAGREFGLTPKDLPYFKTLHALGYHALGMTQRDLMGPSDWTALGKELGTVFTDAGDPDESGALMTMGSRGGDGYLRMLERAAMRQVSLDQEYREEGDYKLNYEYLLRIDGALQSYKEEYRRSTFVDMIRNYTAFATPPRLEILIVDEAQDLVPLQWAMVEKLCTNAKHVYFAGDDDQAIHRWAGVRIGQFMQAADDIKVLGQSYRVPIAPFDLAQSIAKRIEVRQEKAWEPRPERGAVSYHMRMETVPLESGSWTIMARTNGFARDIAEGLWQAGYFYSLKGSPSVSQNKVRAIGYWEAVQKGETLSVDEAQALYTAAPKQGKGAPFERGLLPLFRSEDPTARIGMAELRDRYKLKVPPATPTNEFFRISSEEDLYINHIRKSGEDLLAPPRIKLSTVHAMKGGEDDNTVLFLGSTKACTQTDYPDDEHRVFYVGATRVREHLHVVDPPKRYRYRI